VYRFGAFELDLTQRELRNGGARVPLQPRVFDLLHYLVLRPERAISRSELLETVWGSVSVADGSLSRAVRALRAALRADPTLEDTIQTIRGFGYLFSSPVERVEVPDGPDSRTSISALPPVVSREAEIAQLVAAIEAVRRGERRVAVVAGDAGTGKTALVRRVLRGAATGIAIGEGQCIEGFGAQSPYLPILEALVNLGLAGDDEMRSRVQESIARAAPSWKTHLPVLFPQSEAATGPVEFQPNEMAQQLLDAVELLAATAPLALVVEDVHWADQSTLDLLDSLSRRTTPVSLLIVCTLRTGDRGPSEGVDRFRANLLREERAIELEMTPISSAGVHDYVCWSLERSGREATESLDAAVDWLLERTSGHPLFLAQLVDHLSSLELLGGSVEDSFSAKRLEEAGLPRTLAQLLEYWVAQLDAASLEFLEAASVAGLDFDLRSVAVATGQAMEDLERLVDRLCSEGWLHFRSFSNWPDGSRGTRFRFGHVLFAEAIYERILPARRGRLHQSIADRLEQGHPGQPAISSRLASHYEKSGDMLRSVRHRISAARFAASSQAVDESLHHSTIALASLHHLLDEDRHVAEADLRLSIGLSLSNRHGFGHAPVRESFERALELARRAGDSDREAAATWGVCSCQEMEGELEAARTGGERLLRLADRTRNQQYRLFALDVLCNTAYFQARFGDCIRLEAEADRLTTLGPAGKLAERSIDDVQTTAKVYAGLSHWHRGDLDRAIGVTHEAVDRARRLSRPNTEVVSEVFASILYSLLGDSDRQRQYAEHGLRIAERHDIELWGAIARFMVICADPPSSEQLPELEDTFARMASHGGLGGTFFLGLLAEREAAAEEFEKARHLCEAGIALATRTTERNHLPSLYLLAARLAETSSGGDAYRRLAADTASSLDSLQMQRQVEEALAERVSPQSR
jgi:DNA-binding winged helix-turn-helix (wHTH) protein